MEVGGVPLTYAHGIGVGREERHAGARGGVRG